MAAIKFLSFYTPLKRKLYSIFKSPGHIVFFMGVFIGGIIIILFNLLIKQTSTNEFCEACHVHPHATTSWKQGPHYDNTNGIAVACVECHLPPAGSLKYYTEKARLGAQDAYGKLFKDIARINWDEKSTVEHAASFTYNESCIRCHTNLFPIGLTTKGQDAHLYYTQQKAGELLCINCHLHTGHYSDKVQQEFEFRKSVDKATARYTKPAIVTEFKNYTEYIPGSSVKFDMVAIPGGKFTLGSPQNEQLRNADEGPQVQVEISPFWIGKIEVSWDEYEAFYAQTARAGRSDTQINLVRSGTGIDAITGPTPPYGNPAQGYGKDERPAITMTWYAANVYCEWLSTVTGKKYRLPTEAEWEYACRGGTNTPYFFSGNPKKYTANSFWNKIFGPDTTVINSYIIYKQNSAGKSHLPSSVLTNPFGLLNMTGNVKEFCSDWYSSTIYAEYLKTGLVKNPTGPATGDERVIRGGSYKSDAALVRSAARDHTLYDKWMRTDPQMPKSRWWYSDCNDVGFRVVCEINK